MTLITSFSCYINLEVVSKYFKLDDKVISMVYGDKPVKNSKQKSNRPFFNQATIIVKLDPLRKVNVKIFSNGKIQMTGVKHVDDGHQALDLIIEKLRSTQGKVQLEKVLDSQLEKIYLENREGAHFKDSYPKMTRVYTKKGYYIENYNILLTVIVLKKKKILLIILGF